MYLLPEGRVSGGDVYSYDNYASFVQEGGEVDPVSMSPKGWWDGEDRELSTVGVPGVHSQCDPSCRVGGAGGVEGRVSMSGCVYSGVHWLLAAVYESVLGEK